MLIAGATVYDIKRRCRTSKPSSSIFNDLDRPGMSKMQLEKGPLSERTEDEYTNRVLLSFSVVTNAEKLFSTGNSSKDSLAVIHGIRALSMALIILGHMTEHTQHKMVFRNADTFAEELASNAAAQIVSSLVLVVDTFFFLTGLLVVYLTLNRMKESGGKMNWWIFYLHRYWRLTPLIGLFSLFVAVYLPYCGDGPLWFDAISAGRACKLNWWANFLYVQNFIPFEEMCLGYTWYAAVDFQLFLISPPIIYALYRKPRIGFVVIGLLFLLSTTYTAAYIGLRDLPIFPHTAFESAKEVDYMENVYKMPHCRIGPFLIGMICGYVLHTRRGHIIINKRCVYAGWTASTLLTLALLFAVWPTDARYRQLPPYMAALYGSLSRSVWAACIAWILISCLEGYGGPVTYLLSCKALVPLSRLTFAAYIVHLLPMVLFADTRQQSFDFSPGLLYFFYVGYLTLSYVMALGMCLLFEAPILGLEKFLLAGKM
ncbi:nose resistant to fluoxetine protein 6-like [Amblyomma americanum]